MSARHVLSASIIALTAFLLVIQTGIPQPALATTRSSSQPGASPPLSMTSSLIGGRHPVICYIPNRIFDLLDILRLRMRVGPGLSVGVSATELANVFIGAHATAYVGLRGARGKPELPLPLGLENKGGIEVSVIDATTSGPYAPYTDPLELGFEAQVAIVGINFGIEVFEILDFAAGFIFLDLQKDDF
ncbi:MAG: hypothetical protein WCQ99_00695 [Pseudomonadota bacterium]